MSWLACVAALRVGSECKCNCVAAAQYAAPLRAMISATESGFFRERPSRSIYPSVTSLPAPKFAGREGLGSTVNDIQLLAISESAEIADSNPLGGHPKHQLARLVQSTSCSPRWDFRAACDTCIGLDTRAEEHLMRWVLRNNAGINECAQASLNDPRVNRRRRVGPTALRRQQTFP